MAKKVASVNVKIIYCDPCGWRPNAEEISSSLKAAYGDKISVILEASGGGKFEVFVAENPIFSRLKAGRFPSLEEIKNGIEGEISKLK
ncbi:selenoprotein W-related protein [Candidatus Hakubella thermalkaliphila]|uniref:Selenoprotein W-related protein n=1 Tax=Candidatus Hakubella thermalkaliphila TaxID=2754717 RepID=A0A6V8PXI1_9ACTN|nr:Rdx family protein [Candidatus Hakubella thermalkaliphila]MBT9170757.1 hypothetical protein [Actinomycetota bacterium]GFP22808.1 hypothetical protein HKBW3S09_00275 [Candidatus Hakubella thermalkaliphila]GFP30702.1 selenoprotein W-related protein [Candidatus Hakubella thermalkaliphila]GFP37289.1 selenoprotein W-related protein [Candidatus Hakubella thermalkaliphila]